VLWFRTVNGATIPLNPLPVRVAVMIQGDDGEAVAVRRARSIHFDTCKKHPAQRRTRR